MNAATEAPASSEFPSPLEQRPPAASRGVTFSNDVSSSSPETSGRPSAAKMYASNEDDQKLDAKQTARDSQNGNDFDDGDEVASANDHLGQAASSFDIRGPPLDDSPQDHAPRPREKRFGKDSERSFSRSARKKKSIIDQPHVRFRSAVGAETDDSEADNRRRLFERRKSRKASFFFAKEDGKTEEDFEDDAAPWKCSFTLDNVGDAILFLYEMYMQNVRNLSSNECFTHRL